MKLNRLKKFKPVEADPAITLAVDKLLDTLKTAQRGTFYSWHQFTTMGGVAYGTDKFPTVFNKVRKKLLKATGMLLIAIPTEGAQIATTEQQLARVSHRLLKATRQSRYGIREVSATPDAELTTAQRNLKYAGINQLKRARSTANSARCRHAVLMKKGGE